MMKIPSPKVYPAFLLTAISLSLTVGCGRDTPKMVPVRGKVTLEGGQWPQPGRIFFSSSKPAEGFPAKPGYAIFGKDGSFVVKTGDYEGLMPGEYHISVYCSENPTSETKSGISYLPKKFSNPYKSGLTLKIEPDQSGPVIWEQDFPRARPGTHAK
jgi:hypothetical protein